MNKLEQKILSFVSREKLISQGDNVLVALSGGPDSVSLLYLLLKYRKKFNISVSAFHLNHLLRGKESEGDEKFCTLLCKKNKIPIYKFKADIKKLAGEKKISIEEAARNERYRLIDELIKEHKFDKVATAHNSNDNAETVLINLLSGCGLHGISGIPVKRDNIIRPLFPASKEEILEYLKQNKIKYRVDSSNLSNDYRRNYLRNKIIPLLKKEFNPKLEDALSRSSLIFKQSKDLIDAITGRFIETNVSFKEGRAVVKLENLEAEHELMGSLFRQVIKKYFSREFTYDDYLALASLAANQVGRKIDLSSGLTAVRERGRIEICLAENGEEVFFELKLGDSVTIGDIIIGINETKTGAKTSKILEKSEIIEADNIEDIFILRKWKSGDKFIPLGMRGFKKVSDFLTDQKISSSGKKNQLILLNRNNIVWICGLRIDDRYKIKDKTKRAIHLWIKKKI